MRRSRRDELANADELLDRFARQENRARTWALVRRGALMSLAPVLIATSLGSLFSQPFGWNRYGWLHYLLWGLTALSILPSWWALRLDVGEFLTPRGLEQVRARAASEPQQLDHAG